MRHSSQTPLNCERDFTNEIPNYSHFLHFKLLNVICSPCVKFFQQQMLMNVTSVCYPPADSFIKHYHTIQQCSTQISLVLHIKHLHTPTQRLNSSSESPCLYNEIKSCNIHKLSYPTSKPAPFKPVFLGRIFKVLAFIRLSNPRSPLSALHSGLMQVGTGLHLTCSTLLPSSFYSSPPPVFLCKHADTLGLLLNTQERQETRRHHAEKHSLGYIGNCSRYIWKHKHH